MRGETATAAVVALRRSKEVSQDAGRSLDHAAASVRDPLGDAANLLADPLPVLQDQCSDDESCADTNADRVTATNRTKPPSALMPLMALSSYFPARN